MLISSWLLTIIKLIISIKSWSSISFTKHVWLCHRSFRKILTNFILTSYTMKNITLKHFNFFIWYFNLQKIFILHCEIHFSKWSCRKDMHRFMKMLCHLLLWFWPVDIQEILASDIVIIAWRYPATRTIKC